MKPKKANEEMPTTIDWHYQRRGCKTCGMMDELRSEHGIEVREIVSATKRKPGSADGLDLVESLQQVVAAKGQEVVEFDLTSGWPGDNELLKHIVGPTGNLRAPTIRRGKTFLVESHAERLETQLSGNR